MGSDGNLSIIICTPEQHKHKSLMVDKVSFCGVHMRSKDRTLVSGSVESKRSETNRATVFG